MWMISHQVLNSCFDLFYIKIDFINTTIFMHADCGYSTNNRIYLALFLCTFINRASPCLFVSILSFFFDKGIFISLYLLVALGFFVKFSLTFVSFSFLFLALQQFSFEVEPVMIFPHVKWLYIIIFFVYIYEISKLQSNNKHTAKWNYKLKKINYLSLFGSIRVKRHFPLISQVTCNT